MTEQPTFGARASRGLRLAALGVWAGALLMTGATASVAFPTMRELAPALPGYSAYAQDHWSIAAGHVMRRVFTISDWTQLACMLIAIGTLVVEATLVGWRRLGMAWRVRGGVIVLAAAAAGYSALFMAPRMNARLDEYWESARSGQIAAAQTAKFAFDEDHTLARRLMTGTFALVAAALLTSALGSACDAGACARRGNP